MTDKFVTIALLKDAPEIEALDKELTALVDEQSKELQNMRKSVEEKQIFYKKRKDGLLSKMNEYAAKNLSLPDWYDPKNEDHSIAVFAGAVTVCSQAKKTNIADLLLNLLKN